MKIKKNQLLLLSLGVCLIQPSAFGAEDRGQKLYMSHCSKCHTNGMNNVVPSKPVIGSSYLATFATFKSYLDKPVGTMPHYSHLITDRDTLQDLYKYVKAMDDSAAKEKKEKSKSEKSKSSNETKAVAGSKDGEISKEKALTILNEKADSKAKDKKTTESKKKQKKWSWWPF